MTDPTKTLAGLFILIVEDEVMLAMMLEEVLQDHGCRVALAGSITQALSLIQEATPDGVLLDMNLHGQRTAVVAEELASRAVPFLLVTGYNTAEGDPPVVKAAPRLQKPFNEDTLRRRMVEVFLPPR